jgi:hypothetical protein
MPSELREQKVKHYSHMKAGLFVIFRNACQTLTLHLQAPVQGETSDEASVLYFRAGVVSIHSSFLASAARGSRI